MWIHKEKIKKLIVEYWFNSRLINVISNRLKQEGRASTCDAQRSGLLVVPCDPYTIIGSRGDEAMIMASVDLFRKAFPSEKIYMVVDGVDGQYRLNRAELITNIEFLDVWRGYNWSERVLEAIMVNNPREVVILGADCMDGAWSVNLSIGLVGIYAMSVKLGYKTRLLGFSYNHSPKRLVNIAFKRFGGVGSFNIRDKYSLQRFEKYTGVRAQLVADTAFLLNPDIKFKEYTLFKDWIEQQRYRHNRKVIAFNFHPMLRKYSNENEIINDALTVAGNLHDMLVERDDFALLLLPHDDRNRISDNTMLKPIATFLYEAGWSHRVFYNEKVFRSSQIKALTGLTDALISSRMHLAIAALGMGRPVMAATYQGKFEGLFAHFDMDESLLLKPNDFIDKKKMNGHFARFLNQLDELSMVVSSRLNYVIELAKKNFE